MIKVLFTKHTYHQIPITKHEIKREVQEYSEGGHLYTSS